MAQNWNFFSKKTIFFRTIIALITLISLNCLSWLLLSNREIDFSIALADSLPTSNDLDNFNLLKLGTPPFSQNEPNNISIQPSPVNLTVLSVNPNQITDTEAWFENNNLTLPIYEVPNPFQQTLGNVPEHIPTTFRDNILVKGIRYAEEEFLIYGKNFAESQYLLIYNLKQNKITNGYDFSNYTFSPSFIESDRDYINQTLNWIIPEKNILYFSHIHNTYAESSYGMNAYITALDRNTNQILWRSQPKVCNAANFVVIDSVIICGYGFTAEPDYLYLIDKNTGNILQQIPLKTAPDYIIQKGNKLYVRTYDTDYVFNIEQR